MPVPYQTNSRENMVSKTVPLIAILIFFFIQNTSGFDLLNNVSDNSNFFIQNTSGFDLLQSVSNYTNFFDTIRSKSENNELHINAECLKQLKLFVNNLESFHDGFWALKMIDASAKVPSGILSLNVAWLGNYDECLEIESPKKDVKGNYCLASIKSSLSEVVHLRAPWLQDIMETFKNNTNTDDKQATFLPSVALCIPHKCNKKDVKNVLGMLSAKIKFAVTCQNKDELTNRPFDIGAIITIGYMGISIVLMLVGTLYDDYRNKECKPYPLLVAFSIRTNGKKLFKLNKNLDDLPCLHGLRFLSMLWVVIGHYFMYTVLGPLTNIRDFFKYIRHTESMFFTNAVYSVETFFVISGFLVVYSFMKAQHQGRKFNIVNFYFHRYMRLTPAIVPVVLSCIFLIKYMGSGPFYPQIEMFSEPCRKHWWSTLLHIQNYVNVDERCLGQTWYLNVDWQLYVLAPTFLLLLPKRPIFGLSLIACGIFIAMVSSFTITWKKKLPAIHSNMHGDILEFNNEYYMKTHTRAATWLIGALLGYFLGRIKYDNSLSAVQLPRVGKWLVSLIWIKVLICLPTCVFAGHDVLHSEEYHPYFIAFYNTFARPTWALCLSWIIFACSMGYGGPINTFLSFPFFQVLNRFTYSMYLLHPTIMYTTIYAHRQPEFFSIFGMMYSFWSVYALTFVLSLFWILSFESPIPVIETYIKSCITRIQNRNLVVVKADTDTQSLINSNSNTLDVVETEP